MDQIKSSSCNEYLNDEISFVQNLYNKNEFAEEQLKVFKIQIQEDLLMLYNFRNKIVHNAYMDNNTLPYYVNKCMWYSGDLLRIVIHEHINKRIKDLDEIYITNHLRWHKFISELQNDKHIDLIKYLDNN